MRKTAADEGNYFHFQTSTMTSSCQVVIFISADAAILTRLANVYTGKYNFGI